MDEEQVVHSVPKPHGAHFTPESVLGSLVNKSLFQRLLISVASGG